MWEKAKGLIFDASLGLIGVLFVSYMFDLGTKVSALVYIGYIVIRGVAKEISDKLDQIEDRNRERFDEILEAIKALENETSDIKYDVSSISEYLDVRGAAIRRIEAEASNRT